MDLLLGVGVLCALTTITALLLARGAEQVQRSPFRRLLALVGAGDGPSAAAEVDASKPQIQLPFGRALERMVQRLSPAENRRRLQRRLEAAGMAERVTPVTFLAMRAVAAAAAPVVGFLVYTFMPEDSPYRIPAAIVVGLLIAGLPDIHLHDQTQKRQALLRKAMPDLLDLLVMSVEAGLGFDAAVAHTLKKMDGPLTDEMKRMLRDMQLGLSRGDALRALSIRCQTREVTSFAGAIIQAEQLGGSMAAALRIQSRAMRTRYSQLLREKAGKLPIKMLIPLVMFIFPAIFVILLGPGILKMIDAFSK